MKKLLALLLLFGIVGCATHEVENALFAYSEKKQKKVFFKAHRLGRAFYLIANSFILYLLKSLKSYNEDIT